MHTFNNLLMWAHFIGIGLAVGGGVALARVGPRLVAAPVGQRDELWGFETFFSRLGAAGVAILLVTGPLMVWLKFGGPGGFTTWFWVKMGLVATAVVAVSVHEWAGARFKRGDDSAVTLMFMSGRLAGAAIVFAMLCAVFAFN